MIVYAPLPPRCVATVGASVVESSCDLQALFAFVEGCHDVGLGEDVAFWEGTRLVAVWFADGRRLDLRTAGNPRPAA